MASLSHPYRSVLYIPGSKERALDKARTLCTDAIIFDLEDAVAPDAKVAARGTLAAALREGGYGKRARIVRINALTTEWGLEDARAIREAGPDAILLPKVNNPVGYRQPDRGDRPRPAGLDDDGDAGERVQRARDRGTPAGDGAGGGHQ